MSNFLYRYFSLMIAIFFFCTGTYIKDMIRQINEEMVRNYAWVNANKLSLNINKTNFMLFMPKRFSHCADHIVINQTRIQEVKETKSLGVIIDNKLKWSAHITYISKKISKVLESYLSLEKSSTWRPCYHCTQPLYILIWVIACVGQGTTYSSRWSCCITEQSYVYNKWCPTQNKYRQILYR